ncbi:MAG: apolipoprotein N-acyltransferase [Candidatus Electrothrix sp. Rat3]|nr:apolipoprotein N-acyltransferase [Candidatus Electrothrix rattekaaiensis]
MKHDALQIAAPSNIEPLKGYPPYLRALFTALLLTLAMPGITGWWHILFIALIPLFSALGRLSAKQSICMGMFCGLLYYAGLFYWIIPVMERFGGLHPALAALALLLLAAYMAIYIALFCLLLNRLLVRSRSRGQAAALLLLTAPAVWTGLDFLRGFLFTGLPWMDLGYALYRQPLLIQAADLGGHYLITFSVVLINALLFWLLDRILVSRSSSSSSSSDTSDYHFGHPMTVFLLLSCLGGYSVVRYQQISSETATADTALVSAVQGNIEQSKKWSPTQKEKTVERYLSLSAQALEGEEKPELIVWPETALPFYPPREIPLMNRVRAFVRKNEVYLLTGAPYFTIDLENKKPLVYSNSAVLLNHSGILARYNKQHLVPFGEYIPLRTYLWFIKPLVELIGDFTPGDSFDPLDANRIQAGVLICFESIFPGIARQEAVKGANLLVNLTNDAWYGESSAPYHSWAMTVFRAVENRRSLVRSANTGISGFIDPTGEIHKETPLFKAQAINARTPLLTSHTFFMQGGYHFGAICLALIPFLLYLSVRKQQKKTTEI